MMCLKSDKDSAEKCADCLKKGQILILPTDTVYGFSAVVENGVTASGTDAKIRAIKGRSETKPFIQLIARPEDIFVHTDDIIPDKLLKKWPGALTIIVHEKKSGGTTAYRCPGDPWLRHIIDMCGNPIYSTSVNRSGSPVIDEIDRIRKEFEKETDLIVSDGDKKGALPSTIVAIEKDEIKILRQGSVHID